MASWFFHLHTEYLKSFWKSWHSELTDDKTDLNLYYLISFARKKELVTQPNKNQRQISWTGPCSISYGNKDIELNEKQRRNRFTVDNFLKKTQNYRWMYKKNGKSRWYEGKWAGFKQKLGLRWGKSFLLTYVGCKVWEEQNADTGSHLVFKTGFGQNKR